MAPNYLAPYDIASTSLAAIVAQYQTAAVKMPPKVFLTTGIPAFDCEFLAVSIMRQFGVPLGARAGFPLESAEAQRCTIWRGVVLAVYHLRCAPVGKANRDEFVPPTPAEYDASAREVARDAEVIKHGLVAAFKAGDFGDGWTFALEAWDALQIEGGFVGGMLSYRVGLV